jgi:hypothetical protein
VTYSQTEIDADLRPWTLQECEARGILQTEQDDHEEPNLPFARTPRSVWGFHDEAMFRGVAHRYHMQHGPLEYAVLMGDK